MVTPRIDQSTGNTAEIAAAGIYPRTGQSTSISSARSTDSSALSGLVSFAMSYQLGELNFSDNSTTFAYRNQDNSLALRATSQTNVQLRSEQITFDATFTAESLGLTAKDFKDPTQPLTLKLSYTTSEIEINQKISVNKVNTLRKPEEIVTDLAKALREVFKDQGNKSVLLDLDMEALQVMLGGDRKTSELFTELVMLVAAINLQRKQGESNDYVIKISGKGKPYLNVDEKTDVKGKQMTVDVNITILPPGSGANAAPQETAETPAALAKGNEKSDQSPE